ncbi:hypothetical protein BD779DRAFT_119570 [Infundibulicybe gibba]|nr:hypothetical protein BD779DRAFT_119570 [Infundibulicybe gibba]
MDQANHDYNLTPENTGAPPRRSHSFGKQSYMPGIGQAMLTGMDDNGKVSPPLSHLSSRKHSNEQAIWFPVDLQVPTTVSSSNGHTSPYENRSAASLDAYASASSHGHGAATSSSGHGVTIGMRGLPGDSPRPLAIQTHSQTPPSSFTLGSRPKSKDSLDSKSLRSLLSRLRGSKTSIPDVIVQDTSGSQESIVSRAVSLIRPRSPPPAPPVPIPPVSHMSDFVRRNSSQDRDYLSPPNMTPAGLWPAMTLPPLPSPAASINASDESGTLENLLHPRLMVRSHSNADSSSASLRDHVDYSRPIGGQLINTRMHSTTTFNTQDTAETMTEETVEA